MLYGPTAQKPMLSQNIMAKNEVHECAHISKVNAGRGIPIIQRHAIPVYDISLLRGKINASDCPDMVFR